MMTLHTLKKPRRSTHEKKRVGRGQGSGLGKTAGRGGKGQKARTGNMHFEGFEGGQSPLQRRIPKRGFTNINRDAFAVVNLESLASAFQAGATVGTQQLIDAGLIRANDAKVKILGDGDL